MIDLEHLHQFTGGDVELDREVLDLFIENGWRYLGILEAGGSDNEALHVAAHSLKGSARGVGAKLVESLAEETEHAITAGQNILEIDLAPLRSEVQAAADFIASHFS